MNFEGEINNLLDGWNIRKYEKGMGLNPFTPDDTDYEYVAYVLFWDGADDTHLNMDNNYWGSEAFNSLLKKSGYDYEWYDSPIVFIYKSND